MAHAGRGYQVENAVDHAKACTKDGNDGELFAGKLLKRGGGDGGLDLDVFHGQVAHGLVAVKKREFAHELAELVGAGVFYRAGSTACAERADDRLSVTRDAS